MSRGSEGTKYILSVYFYVSKHTNYLIWTGKWNWELGFEVHYLPSSASNHRCLMYSVVQKNPCMFEFSASLPPTNLGLPMHSPSALTRHMSLNLAKFFFTRPCKLGREMESREDLDKYYIRKEAPTSESARSVCTQRKTS